MIPARRVLLGAAASSMLVAFACSNSGGGGCDWSLSPTQTMSDSCEADYSPTPTRGGNSDNCNAKRGVGPEATCHHRGSFWPHDWAADCYGNEFYPTDGNHTGGTKDDWGFGCDADVYGKGFDGIVHTGGRTILFEVKTGRLSKTDGTTMCTFLSDIIKNDIIADVKTEEKIASDCGASYQLVLTDKQTFDWADGYFRPPHKVKVVYAGDDCGSAPPVPDEYRTRAQSDLSEMYWHDELARTGRATPDAGDLGP